MIHGRGDANEWTAVGVVREKIGPLVGEPNLGVRGLLRTFVFAQRLMIRFNFTKYLRLSNAFPLSCLHIVPTIQLWSHLAECRKR